MTLHNKFDPLGFFSSFFLAFADFQWSKKLHELKKSKFNIREFRPYQEEVINATMSKRDVILVMPTGGGKSLCFQLPALLCNGKMSCCTYKIVHTTFPVSLGNCTIPTFFRKLQCYRLQMTQIFLHCALDVCVSLLSISICILLFAWNNTK